MAIRRSAFVILLAAALLFLSLGMATAVSQNWYMLDLSPETPEGADCLMQKGSGSSATYQALKPGDSGIWGADEAVAVDQIDMAGQWDVHLYIYVQVSTYDVSVNVELGKLTSGDGKFVLADGEEEVIGGGTHYRWWNPINIHPETFPISYGESLAVRVTNNGSCNIHVVTSGDPNSRSYIASPASDPNYPVPELPTVVLTGMGMLLLAGFVVYRRR